MEGLVVMCLSMREGRGASIITTFAAQHGLKAQQVQSTIVSARHGLKAQQVQSNALGYVKPEPAPCKGKSKEQPFAHTFALTGR